VATAEIPYEPNVVATSIARGVPFVLSQPQSQVAVRIAGLADILSPVSGGRAGADVEPVPAEPAASKRRRRLGLGRTRGDQATASD